MRRFSTALLAYFNIAVSLNLWIKQDGQIIKNGLRSSVEDLDELPFYDRMLYDDCKILRSVPPMKFLTGRGCPLSFAFCFYHKFNILDWVLSRMVRKRSADSLIEEIKDTAQKYNLQFIRFPDDTFAVNRSWTINFLQKYNVEIGLSYTGLTRANELYNDTVKILKASGCLNIYFGVETGNENLRNQILKKKLTNKQIKNAATS